MKSGLVMQGGAMRGLFTCGIIDVFMENGIVFDGAIGVSAGAVFGCNYKSRQIDRPHRYNINIAGDSRVGTIKNWLKTGNAFDVDFCYRELPYELDPFDFEAYKNNPMEFYVGCTDVETGKPEYHLCPNGDDEDFKWFQASASMPVLSKIVEVDGKKLLDGGASDSIPIHYFESIGYDKNVVILTREYDYYEQPNFTSNVVKLVYQKKYPKLVESYCSHHNVFNATIDYLKEKEKKKEIIILRPEYPLNIKMNESDKHKLNMVYNHGREVALKHLEEIRNFIKK